MFDFDSRRGRTLSHARRASVVDPWASSRPPMLLIVPIRCAQQRSLHWLGILLFVKESGAYISVVGNNDACWRPAHGHQTNHSKHPVSFRVVFQSAAILGDAN